MMNIGMIGLGDIATKAYLPILAARPDIHLKLMTRNVSTLQTLGDTYRIHDRFTNLEDLLRSGIDAAFVHAATAAHPAYVADLLRQGIPVYVDKPLADNTVDCLELSSLAKVSGTPLMIGFNRRYAPMIADIKQKNMKPTVLLMQKNRTRLPGPIRSFVYDDMIHVIDTLRFLADSPLELVDVQAGFINEFVSHVMLTMRGESCSVVGLMHRDSGKTEETLEWIAPAAKIIVRGLSEKVDYENDTVQHRAFGDWVSTLKKRGFEDIVAEFLCLANEPSHFNWEQQLDDALETHALCELIVTRLDAMKRSSNRCT